MRMCIVCFHPSKENGSIVGDMKGRLTREGVNVNVQEMFSKFGAVSTQVSI